VPGERRLLQQPPGQGPAASLVVRPGLAAEQRPGETVGLLGPHTADPQQQPRILAEQSVRSLSEDGGDLRREGVRRTALGQHAPHRLDHLGHGCAGRRRRPRTPCRLGDGRTRSGRGLAEHGARRLLAALHGPHGG
jgi:hypothetical protein